MSKADRDMMGRWSPKWSEEYIRTYRVVIKAVTDKHEETAKKEVAKVRIFDKEICGSISAGQQGKRESTDKRAEVRGGELGPIEEQEEEDEQEWPCSRGSAVWSARDEFWVTDCDFNIERKLSSIGSTLHVHVKEEEWEVFLYRSDSFLRRLVETSPTPVPTKSQHLCIQQRPEERGSQPFSSNTWCDGD